MGCTAYSRMRSESYAKLVQELAPDSVLRALFAPIKDESPTPELFRGLISTLLRAAEQSVVRRVRSALQIAAFSDVRSGRKPANFAAVLGFTITTLSDTRREVLHDIISSATSRRPLRADGPALKFYHNAGHGSLDAEEYEKPEAEGLGEAVAFGQVQSTLEVVRQYGLAEFINYAAEAVVYFRNTIKTERILVGDSRIRTILVDGILKKGPKLSNDSLHSLQLLFASVCDAESPKGRSDIVTHMVGAFAGTAAKSEDASSLGFYLREVLPTKVVLHACVVYLKQRFGVKNVFIDAGRKLTMKNFVNDVLDVKIVKNRPNHVLPAVCAAILKCLVESADNTAVENNGNLFEHDDMLLATMHSKGDELLRKCEPDGEDKDWFKAELYNAQLFASLISQRMKNTTPTRR